MSDAEPITPEQVDDLRAAMHAYEKSRNGAIPEHRGLALGMLIYIAMNDLPAILSALDHYHAMLRRMDKHGPAWGGHEIIYFNRPI